MSKIIAVFRLYFKVQADVFEFLLVCRRQDGLAGENRGSYRTTTQKNS
jgi:hypothetical protein